MPNNFKLTGNYYVSKFGNDSWDGLTKDTPKRTINGLLNSLGSGGSGLSVIIGSGVYSETISSVNKAITNFYGDGVVILEGQNARTLTFQVISGASYLFNNIIFRNYSTCSFTAPLGVGNFIDCNFLTNFSVNTPSTIFTKCNLINSIITGNASSFVSFILSNLINVSFSSLLISRINDSYVNNTSIVTMNPSVTTTNFNYNNIQGPIVMNTATAVTTGVYRDSFGNYYDLSISTSTGTGTLADPYGRPLTNSRAFGFTNHRILYPTFNASSSAYDPKFNSVENYDFSLASDSRMIGAGSDGVSNIGGTKYAVRNPAASSAFSGSSATVDAGLGFRYTNYVISGSAVTGSVTSAPILVNNLDKKVLQKVTYNGLLAFNKDTGSVSGSNVNVPDVETFTSASGNAGANPDRLVYYMRFTSGSTVPTTDAEWENAGLWTAGTYNVFEWNTKPSIDLSGRGNGSSSFNPADTQTFIQAQWIQLQIKLRNDYLL